MDYNPINSLDSKAIEAKIFDHTSRQDPYSDCINELEVTERANDLDSAPLRWVSRSRADDEPFWPS